MTREAIMRRALHVIATEGAKASQPGWAPTDVARHALRQADALPHRIPCGCKVHIDDDLTISVVVACQRHQDHRPKRRRKS